MSHNLIQQEMQVPLKKRRLRKSSSNSSDSDSANKRQQRPRAPSLDDNSYQLANCKVCNQPTVNRIRCGVLACEACKKFFQRNRKQVTSLRCVSGTYNCSLSDDRAALTSSGTVWRLVCPRCRLVKCLAVGMRVLGRKSTRRHSANSLSNKQTSANGGLPNSSTPIVSLSEESFDSDSSKAAGDKTAEPNRAHLSPPPRSTQVRHQFSEHTASAESTFNPSAAEYRILNELLYFRQHPALASTGVVEVICHHLNMIHQSMLTHQQPNAPHVVIERVLRLQQVCDGVRSIINSCLANAVSQVAATTVAMFSPTTRAIYTPNSSLGAASNGAHQQSSPPIWHPWN